MNRRDNLLKAIRFEGPDQIPLNFMINAACWHHYDPEYLQDLMEGHPLLFPDFERQEQVQPELLLNQCSSAPYTDPWGCIWETTDDGITGSVRQHPLKDWSDFQDYEPPDPEHTDGIYPLDWQVLQDQVETKKGNGEFVWGSLPHGHTFLRLVDIRGFENLTYDMHDEEADLIKLLQMVESFNLQYVLKWLELEPDMMGFPEDLGMQAGPMISPGHFRKYIKPVYQTLMKPALDSGSIVHMHCDGDIRTLANDLIECGVAVINLQDLVNGIDWIANTFAGRLCIDLDIDRQHVTTRGSPEQIDLLIREEVEKLGSRKGGLILTFGLYPGVPRANIEAVMDAMEKYSGYYS